MRAKTKQEELQQEEQPYDPADALTQPDWQEQIRRRAYELSELRGGQSGDEMSDWYRAEAETRAVFGSAEVDGLTKGEEADGSLSARA